jgi:hypothetical protein
MNKSKNAPMRPVFVQPSRIEWTDERLDVLDKQQLANLLENLQTQVSGGRVSEATAAELERRIMSRLPVRTGALRRRRPRSEVRLEARVAEQLGGLAVGLARRYDVSADTATRVSSGIKGFRPEPMTDSKGNARAGAAVKNGIAAIERYVGYRSRDSFAALAFVLLAETPEQTGGYVLLATDDLLGDDEAPNEYSQIAGQHGWSANSRARMRARAVSGFEEGAARYEQLIARMAAPQE